MHPTTARPMITVTADGTGVVSHVGSRLLAGMADRSGLTDAFSDALAGLRERRSGGRRPGPALAVAPARVRSSGRTPAHWCHGAGAPTATSGGARRR